MLEFFAWWCLRRARKMAIRRRWQSAAGAYSRYLRLRPHDAAAWVQFGHASKEMGNLSQASDAYSEATRIAPNRADAWFQLAHIQRLRDYRAEGLACLERALEADPDFAPAIEALVGQGERERLPMDVQRKAEEGPGGAVFAYTRTSAWRDAFVIPPAPATAFQSRTIVVLAEDQTGSGAATTGPTLLLRTGTTIDPAALDWFGFALDRTSADIIYCDHVAGGRRPCLQPMPDPIWFASREVLPPAILLRRGIGPGCDPHDLLCRAIASFRTAHLALPLAQTPDESPPVAKSLPTVRPPDASIQVVIQTRDRVDLLEPCVRTLRATAARPDLLDVVIVDNRSANVETAELLARWHAQGVARTLSLDEPFNWSRANNVAAAEGTAPLLLFLNNDTETETAGWDERVRSTLQDEDIGVIGALLLYPDRTVQHAGIVFGMNDGDPIHDGIGRPPGTGPMNRWHRRRSVPAVTGAWLAMRRDVFLEVDGFDEGLAVAFNDVDLCLAVRASGRRIMFDPDVVALHRESMTRGAFLDAEALARDRREAARLLARWKGDLLFDPGYNPAWARSGHPCNGLRIPNVAEVVDWLDRSASRAPWGATAASIAKAPLP